MLESYFLSGNSQEFKHTPQYNNEEYIKYASVFTVSYELKVEEFLNKSHYKLTVRFDAEVNKL